MVQTNEYFDGKVKSLAINLTEGKQTIGVIEPGEYEFGTGTKEIMHVISGSLEALLPGATKWELFTAGKHFEVASGVKFKVKTSQDAAYLCEYK